MINTLAKERTVFHSEADFQHSLTWVAYRENPDLDFRLEVPIRTGAGPMYVDILAQRGEMKHFVELKYKTRDANVQVDTEIFDLQYHGAQPLGRYDFLKDIQRLEEMVLHHAGSCGTAIFLTNDSAYWSQARANTDTSAAFNLSDGRQLGGYLIWSESASAGTKRGRESPIHLQETYAMEWSDFSTVGSARYAAFRFLLVHIDSQE